MPPHYKDFEEQLDKRRAEQRHGQKERSERGERPSWRDLDRKRDQSPHSDQRQSQSKPQPGLNRYQEAQANKALKEQLDGLFADKQQDALSQAILDAADRGAIQSAVAEYIDKKGTLPSDPTLLEKALDCRSDKTLRAVVADISTHLGDMEPVHRRVLLLKMKTKARTSFDRKVSAAIKALLDEYGSED